MKHKKRRTNLTLDERSTMSAVVVRPDARGMRRNWSLNVRLLVLTILVLLIAVPSLVALHAMQVRRNAASLFERAKQLESKGDFGSAAETLFRYLKFRPYDGSARVVLAQVFDKGATSPAAKQRAAEHYLAALGYEEDRADLRVRLAEILLDLGRVSEAQDECITVLFADQKPNRADLLKTLAVYEDKLESAKLLAEQPDANTAIKLLAYAWVEQTTPRGPISPDDSAALLKIALNVNPGDVRLSESLAAMYRDQLTVPNAAARVLLADKIMNKLGAEQPRSGVAQLSLYRYRTKYGLADADKAIEQALSLEANNIEIVLVAAIAAENRGDQTAADQRFAQSAKLQPADVRSYVGAAASLIRRNKTGQAVTLLQDAIPKVGANDITLRVLLVQANLQLKDFAAAEKTIVESRQRLSELGPLLRLTARAELKSKLDALEAERLIGIGQFNRAVPLLRQLATSQSGMRNQGDAALTAHRWQRLAEVYVQLGFHELAAQAFEKQAESTLKNIAPRLAAAEAWQTAGRADLALDLLAQATKHPQATAESWTAYARVALEKHRQSGSTDATKFNAILASAKAANPGSVDLAFIEAQGAVAANKSSDAVTIIERIVTADPMVALPTAILAYQSMGDTKRADHSLTALRELLGGDTKQVTLLEAELHRRRGEFAACEKILQSLAAAAPETEQQVWQRRIGSVKVQAGDADAKDYLTNLTKSYPDDIWAWEQLAELALQADDFAALKNCESSLQAIEGDEGSLWKFYRGMRLASNTNPAAPADLSAVDKIQQELENLRPVWSGTLQLKGWLAQRRGQFEEAADAYRRAVQAGARNVRVFEGLISVLYASNHLAEADQTLVQLQNSGFQSRNLDSLSPRVLLRTNNFEEAIAAARSGTRLRPQDSLAQIWLGQTLAVASERNEDASQRSEASTEAEKAFDRAVEIAPTDPRGWSGLVWFHARQQNREKAHEAIKGLRTKAKIAEPQRLLAIGQAYQMLGDNQEAEQAYIAASAMLPKDKSIHERLARFYLSFSPDKAEGVYRRLLKLDPNSKSAKRNLAMLLAVQGSDDRYSEAVTLLENNSAETTDSRLQAIFLLKRGKPEDLRQARRLLEPIVADSASPPATDRRLLAAVYEAQKETTLAKSELAKLLQGTPAPIFLAAYVDFLVRNDMAAEAAESTTRLRQSDPASIRTARTHAKWLQAMGKSAADIQAALQEFQKASFNLITTGSQAAKWASEFGQLCSEFEFDSQAELAFNDALKRFPEHSVRQAFATWLLDRRQIDSAVQVAQQAIEATDSSAAAVQLLSNVLTFAANAGLNFPDAERRLEAAIASRGSEGNLSFEFATLRHMQGRVEEAIVLYRQALRKTPQNVPLLNNLAMVLLERPGGDQEALQCISRAISLAGPVNELRDTHALVLGKVGKPDEARQMLQGLVKTTPNNARYQFHLAVACVQLGNLDEATEAIRKAKANKLDDELLTPYERASLKNIEQQLDASSAKTSQASSTNSTPSNKSPKIGAR